LKTPFRRASAPALAPFTIAALAALAVSLPARAAPATEPDLGETIVVAAPRASTAPGPGPGAAVSVVDATSFAGEAKDVAALVSAVPGVRAEDHGGLGQYASVTIRGSEAEHVKVFLDGLPLDTVAGGGVDLAAIPAQLVSRVEVVRGVAGARYGSGALGGVVNLETAPVRAGVWSAGAAGGSFGTWQLDASRAVGGERWGLLGAAAGSGSDGQFTYRCPDTSGCGFGIVGASAKPGGQVPRLNNGASSGAALLKGFWLPESGRVDGLVQLSGYHRDLAGTPGDLTPSDWQEERRGVGALRYRSALGDGFHLDALASGRMDEHDVRLSFPADREISQRGNEAGAGISLGWSGAPGTFALRGDVSREGLSGGDTGDHARATFGAGASGEVPLAGDRLRLGAAVRAERAGDFSGLSAGGGARLALAGPLSLRASVARSYRVPDFAELYLEQGLVEPNPALRPEAGIGGDAALVLEGARARASVGAFVTLYRDLIVYEAASFQRVQPQNDAKTLARGLEADAALAPIPALLDASASLAYTFLHDETLRGPDNEVGKDVPFHPRHQLHARAGIAPGPVDLHAELDWTSRQFQDRVNSGPIPAVFLVGAGASLRLLRDPELRVHLEVKNLLDDRSLLDSFGNPLPGRTVLLAVRAGSAPQRGHE
jgi:outer membrane cobalamin receptor